MKYWTLGESLGYLTGRPKSSTSKYWLRMSSSTQLQDMVKLHHTMKKKQLLQSHLGSTKYHFPAGTWRLDSSFWWYWRAQCQPWLSCRFPINAGQQNKQQEWSNCTRSTKSVILSPGDERSTFHFICSWISSRSCLLNLYNNNKTWDIADVQAVLNPNHSFKTTVSYLSKKCTRSKWSSRRTSMVLVCSL